MNRADDPLHIEIQKVYRKYRPPDRPPNEFHKDNCKKVTDTLKSYGFSNITSRLFYQTRTLAAPDYIGLLNTYSDHRAMGEEAKKGLEQGIASAINRLGGKLSIYDTMDLYLAQKM